MRRHVTKISAAVLVLLTGWLTTIPTPPSDEIASAARPLSFARSALEPVLADRWQSERQVAPELTGLRSWISGVGASVAMTDLRQRGMSGDLCHVDPRTDTVTISPAPGTPADYAPFAPSFGTLVVDRSTSAPTGCLPGDFNEDGLEDLLVYFWGRTPILLSRRPGTKVGANSFTPAELIADRSTPEWYTDTITSADVDGDGHADLVVGNYFPDGSRLLDRKSGTGPAFEMNDSMSRSMNGGLNRILLNEHKAPGFVAKFSDIKEVLSSDDARAWTLAIGAQDLNDDGLPELYFANDFGPDRLYVNHSKPGHVELSAVTGRGGLATPKSKVLGNDSFKGMGIDFGDLNADGRTDMFVSNISASHGLMETNYAWINDGGDLRPGDPAPFYDASEKLGLARSGWGWDVKLVDLLNDGAPELVQTLGFAPGKRNAWPQVAELAMTNDGLVRNPHAWMQLTRGWGLSAEDHPAIFRRTGGTYVNVGHVLGLDQQGPTRAVATGDVDGDGRVDFAIASQWGDSFFYRNTAKRTGRSLDLRLVRQPYGNGLIRIYPGDKGASVEGTPAIGAEARVQLPGVPLQSLQVDGGNGHAAARSPELHFGLGDVDPAREIDVSLSWVSVEGRKFKTFHLTPGRWTVQLGR